MEESTTAWHLSIIHHFWKFLQHVWEHQLWKWRNMDPSSSISLLWHFQFSVHQIILSELFLSLRSPQMYTMKYASIYLQFPEYPFHVFFFSDSNIYYFFYIKVLKELSSNKFHYCILLFYEKFFFLLNFTVVFSCFGSIYPKYTPMCVSGRGRILLPIFQNILGKSYTS